MNFKLIIFFTLIFHLNAMKNKTRTKLKDSYGHKGHKLAKIGPLDKESKLTLTLVTGSLNNSQLVADYYSSFGKNLTIYEQTNMHVKLNGKVSFLSQLFNTTFIEYKCDNHTEINDAQRKRQKCYASNSEVSIPETLKSSIIGIMGLEQVLDCHCRLQMMTLTLQHQAVTLYQLKWLPFMVSRVAPVRALQLVLFVWAVTFIKVIYKII